MCDHEVKILSRTNKNVEIKFIYIKIESMHCLREWN